jgi:hypothetical protein
LRYTDNDMRRPQANPNAPRFDQDAGYQNSLERAGNRKDKRRAADSDVDEEEADDDYDDDDEEEEEEGADSSGNPMPNFDNLTIASPTYSYGVIPTGYSGPSTAPEISYTYGANTRQSMNTIDGRNEVAGQYSQ